MKLYIVRIGDYYVEGFWSHNEEGSLYDCAWLGEDNVSLLLTRDKNKAHKMFDVHAEELADYFNGEVIYTGERW